MNFKPVADFMDHLTDWRIPGNSIRICLDGKEVFSYESGYCDLENKIPMNDEGLLYIFSCSKPITVTAALQLYEKGLFRLDDPLYDFIPEYKKMYINRDGELTEAKTPITLRHLFTMTAGFNYNTKCDALKKAVDITDGSGDTLTAIKCLAEEPLGFEPGTKWHYSLCHDVLGGVVEVISGKKFRDYVKENIFMPLDMNLSCYHDHEAKCKIHPLYRFVNSDETDIVKLQSQGISKADGRVELAERNFLRLGPQFDSGGSGVITSINDYSKFACALSMGGIGQNGERIISPETIQMLKTNQLTTPELLKCLTWKQLEGYGYGLGVRALISKEESGSTGNLGEFGWGGAAGATLLVDTDLKLSVSYAHHMLNPQEDYYQPRLRNAVYDSLKL